MVQCGIGWDCACHPGGQPLSAECSRGHPPCPAPAEPGNEVTRVQTPMSLLSPEHSPPPKVSLYDVCGWPGALHPPKSPSNLQRCTGSRPGCSPSRGPPTGAWGSRCLCRVTGPVACRSLHPTFFPADSVLCPPCVSCHVGPCSLLLLGAQDGKNLSPDQSFFLNRI